MSESREAGSFDLIVKNVDGTNRRRLFTTNGTYIYGVAWSPDSSRLVVTTEPPKTEPERLLFIDAATGSQTTVKLGIPERAPTSVSWSEQGVLAVETVTTVDNATSLGELYTLRPDGTDVRVLARPQYPEQGLSEPRWSPDGHRLVFTRERQRGKPSDVLVVDPVGNVVRRVRTLHPARSVTWAPDGQHLVFITGDDDLYAVSLDGSGERLIARHFYEPDWRPKTRYQLPASGA